MEIRPGNATWQGARDEQQDAFGFSSFDDAELRAHGGVLMVLADGMGGMSGGREASHTAVQQMMAAYAEKSAQETIPQALERALQAANAAVYELAISREGEGEVGTTLVATVVHDSHFHWISVGDSRLYRYRAADDSLTPCTEDHTHLNALLEQVGRGELSRAEAEADPDGAALVSFLGLRELPRVDRSRQPLRLAQGDRLLLVSDGVYNALSEQDIALLLRNDAQSAAEALIKAVKQRAGPTQDNTTAAVIAMGDLPKPATAAKTEAPRPRGHAASGKTPPASKRTSPLILGTGALLLLALGIGIGVFVPRIFEQPPPDRGEVATAGADSAGQLEPNAGLGTDVGPKGKEEKEPDTAAHAPTEGAEAQPETAEPVEPAKEKADKLTTEETPDPAEAGDADLGGPGSELEAQPQVPGQSREAPEPNAAPGAEPGPPEADESGTTAAPTQNVPPAGEAQPGAAPQQMPGTPPQPTPGVAPAAPPAVEPEQAPRGPEHMLEPPPPAPGQAPSQPTPAEGAPTSATDPAEPPSGLLSGLKRFFSDPGPSAFSSH